MLFQVPDGRAEQFARNGRGASASMLQPGLHWPRGLDASKPIGPLGEANKELEIGSHHAAGRLTAGGGGEVPSGLLRWQRADRLHSEVVAT